MPPRELPTLSNQISADPQPHPPSDTIPSPPNTTHFTSRHNPERLGNTAPIAFGGCTIAIAVHSAHQTLPQPPSKPYHLYSVLGTFHGPTRVDRPLHTAVTATRNTKTFATRRVLATQTQDDGSTRTCADFFIDFHVQEPALLTYSVPPFIPSVLSDGPTHPSNTRTNIDILTSLQETGHIKATQASAFRTMFHMSETYIETRHHTAGITSHNLFGLAPRHPTPQDDLPIPSKTSYEWLRIRPSHLPSLNSSPSPSSTTPTPTSITALHTSALTFLMDQALSFLPLNHTHRGFPDAGACSTLEFALRLFVPVVDMQEWHLRERRAVAAGGGRTFSEGSLWGMEGGLVCSMSQVCILRPLPGASAVEGEGSEKGTGKGKVGSKI